MTTREWIKNNISEFDKNYPEIVYDRFLESSGLRTNYKQFLKIYEDELSIVDKVESNDKNNVDDELLSKDKTIQKLRDLNNQLRRTNRNIIRDNNSIECLLEKLLDQLPRITLSKDKIVKSNKKNKYKFGIIHLTDVHANTRVIPNEANNNIYNIDVLSKRLDMYITKALEHFKAVGITHVYLVLGGDLLSSTRRQDEQLAQVTSITNACYILVNMLSQVIQRIVNNGYPVTITGIVGNESRLNQLDFNMSYTCASENFDWNVLLMLKAIFDKNNNEVVRVLLPKNPISSILQIPTEDGNFNVLINHGYNTKCSEDGADKVLKSVDNYTDKIHLAIFGHLHHYFSLGNKVWSGTMMGNNAYSTNSGYSTAAEQTIYIIESPTQFYALPIFIQDEWQKYAGFDYDKELAKEAYLEYEYGYKGPTIILR